MPDRPAPRSNHDDAQRVLVINDSPLPYEHVIAALGAHARFEVIAPEEVERALGALDEGRYDAVVLDVGARHARGFATLRQIRTISAVPVVVVAEARSLDEIEISYELGADDFVVKPVSEQELAYRVQAIIRRQSGGERRDDRLQGPNTILMRVRAHTVSVGGRPLALTPKEFDVLHHLLERRGEVITADDLSVEIWGYETYGSRNYVEAHVSRLRTRLRLAGAPDVIETVRGAGYVIR